MYYEIFKGSDGLWYAHLRLNAHNVLARTGDGYVHKAGAQNAVRLMIATNAGTPVQSGPDGLLSAFIYDTNGLRFEIYTDATFLKRWRLASQNGNKIALGISAHFDDVSCRREIEAMMATNYLTTVFDENGVATV